MKECESSLHLSSLVFIRPTPWPLLFFATNSMQNENPFGDDNQLDVDPFLNEEEEEDEEEEEKDEFITATTTFQSTSNEILVDAPMPQLSDPIQFIPKSSFKLSEVIYDALFIGNYLIICHPLKISVYDAHQGTLLSHFPHIFDTPTCCCQCPEFEDPSLFIWLGCPNGEIWCLDMLGSSLESQRHLQVSKYQNLNAISGGVLLFKQSKLSRSPIKSLVQQGTTIIAMDAYATLYTWLNVELNALHLNPIIHKIPITTTTFTTCCFSLIQPHLICVGVEDTLCLIHLPDIPTTTATTTAMSTTTAKITAMSPISNDMICIGDCNGFIHIYTMDLKRIKSIHFSTTSIAELIQRPCAFISQPPQPVLYIALQNGEYYAVRLDQMIFYVIANHPPLQSHLLHTHPLHRTLLLRQQVDPQIEACISLFMVLFINLNNHNTTISTIPLSLMPWQRRMLYKQQMNAFSNKIPLHIRIVSWNMDSCKPTELMKPSVVNKKKRHRLRGLSPFNKSTETVNSSNAESEDEDMSDPLQMLLRNQEVPDVLVIGFQEVVDLESKRVHAKSLFNSSKQQQTVHDVERSCRDWLFAVERGLETVYVNRFKCIASEGMVGLFLMIFVRETLRPLVRGVEMQSIKTGLKGMHGNKGGISCRLLINTWSYQICVRGSSCK